MTDILNAELHCHNTFSNYRNGSSRMPFDCGVRFEDQLQAALNKKIDVLFVTNHNTLDGYNQMLEYQKSHEKFQSIKIYPAEEVTIDNNGHVLAYGIHKAIRPGMTLEETLDEIERQGAVSCAAHPFAVTNGIREKAAMCDMMESFNSNNVDRFSDLVAGKFAEDNNIPAVAGSDSHVLTTIGRCVNTIESENNLDSIIQIMKSGKVKIVSHDYASKSEIYEHARYILDSSRDSLLEYALKHHPRAYLPAKWALNSYTKDPDSLLWRSVAAFTLHLTKRVSEKVNMRGHNPEVFVKRPWKQLVAIGLLP
ncbi:MAG: PHP-associated domain-containing protein [Thermoproteota archaeon]